MCDIHASYRFTYAREDVPWTDTTWPSTWEDPCHSAPDYSTAASGGYSDAASDAEEAKVRAPAAGELSREAVASPAGPGSADCANAEALGVTPEEYGNFKCADALGVTPEEYERLKRRYARFRANREGLTAKTGTPAPKDEGC